MELIPVMEKNGHPYNKSGERIRTCTICGNKHVNATGLCDVCWEISNFMDFQPERVCAILKRKSSLRMEIVSLAIIEYFEKVLNSDLNFFQNNEIKKIFSSSSFQQKYCRKVLMGVLNGILASKEGKYLNFSQDEKGKFLFKYE